MKSDSLGTVTFVQLGVLLSVVGFCFDYTLQNTFGKDIPWYADVVAGLFASPVTVPATVVLWVLKLCGIPMPLIG